MPQTTFAHLDAELDAISYEWLLEQHAGLLRAVEAEVAAGKNADQIYRRVLERTARGELARRCEQAARYVAGGVA